MADEEKEAKIVNFTEKSKAQITSSFGRELTSPLLASYKTYRTIRKHPTISLARALVAASIMAGSWTVEQDDDVEEEFGDEIKDFIRDQFEPVRELIIENAIKHGKIDFGWQPFETVFGLTEEGLIGIEKIKPLLQDITTILTDIETGAFEGYLQSGNGRRVVLEARYVLHIAFGIEGTQWYGTSLLENARESLNQWREANAGAERYDAKVAGATWIVHFPIGSNNVDGVLTDNAVIADTMLSALESSGSLTVPNAVAAHVKEMSNDNPMWKIELIEDKGGRQPTFVDRLKYLDALLVRSLEMPERAILEGQFGTKAEAGTHGDIVIMNVTQWDQHIANEVNSQPVNEVLEQNFGKRMRDKVYIVPSPLVDAQLAFLREIYTLFLTNQALALDEFPTIDTNAIKDHLGVPKSEETAQAGEVDEDDDGEPLEEGLDEGQRARMASRIPVTGDEETDGIIRRIAKKLGLVVEGEEDGE